MEAITPAVSVSELRTLLHSLMQYAPDVSIRYRMKGDLWYPNFLKIVNFEEGKPALLRDDKRNKLIVLSDVTNISEFELSGRFYHFEPNEHYRVLEEEYVSTY